MTPSNRLLVQLAGLVALVSGALGSAGCVTEHDLQPGLFAFDVSLAASDPLQATGTPFTSLPYVSGGPCASATECGANEVCFSGECAYRLLVDVTAIGRDGLPFPYRGPVSLRVTPGRLRGPGPVLVMENGKLTDVEVHLTRGIGKTHIWFEEDGVLPRLADYGQCNDGIDNDDNGFIDLADAGCEGAADDLEAPVSLATGVSPTIYFDNPTIRDIQLTDQISTSPLVGKQVQVTSGNLIVTNVIANGFYVIDLDDQHVDRLYNGLFVFTFSKPEGIDYGDKLCGFSGALDEFVGMTQIEFPSFIAYYPGNPLCEGFEGLDPSAQIPEPYKLTDLLVSEFVSGSARLTAIGTNSSLLEKYESNLVSFTDVELSTRFIACDRNKNGRIDDGDENTCRNECQNEALCTDLESYFQFAQWAGVVAGKKKIYGSVALADDFKPLEIDFLGDPDQTGRCDLVTTSKGFIEYTCPAGRLESLTGSLRHIFLCGDPDPGEDDSRCGLQFWVVDPRFDGDVKVSQ